MGQIFPFEGRDKFLHKLEEIKDNSPKTQSAKIAAKYAIKPSLKREWDLSVDEAEEASKLSREQRVHSLTFEYKLSSKMNLRRKSDVSLQSGFDSKRKKLTSSPEDIYDFDDDADAFNISESTPGLMWRKRSVKGDFAVYVERHIEKVEKEHPGAERQELEAMLQRRWDLLGDDLRALYTDRKSIPTKDLDMNPVPTTKPLSTPKMVTPSKSNAKQNSTKKLQKVEPNDSNESDSEGNLVIAETLTRKTPNRRVPKSFSKTIDDSTDVVTNTEPKLKPKSSSAKKSSKKGKTSPKESDKALVKNMKTKDNGVTEKLGRTSDQALTNFGIDYLDEFASSEDTSSTSEPEAVEGKTNFDKFCVVCNESDATDLMSCSGICFQMFHKKCVKFEGLNNQFKCEECESG